MRRPGGRRAATPMSIPHGTSLATTAGITSVISGVLLVGLLAQAPPAGSPDGWLVSLAGLGLALAIVGLFIARNRVGLALDLAASSPELAAVWGARAQAVYHAGMAAFFAGLGCGVFWRLAAPHGLIGTLAAAALGCGAVHALAQALTYRRDARLLARLSTEPEPVTLHVAVPGPFMRSEP